MFCKTNLLADLVELPVQPVNLTGSVTRFFSKLTLHDLTGLRFLVQPDGSNHVLKHYL